MLKETETEETIGFFVTFLIIGGILIREGPGLLGPPPPDCAYEVNTENECVKITKGKCYKKFSSFDLIGNNVI